MSKLIKELEKLPSCEINISGAHYISLKKAIEIINKHQITGEQLEKAYFKALEDEFNTSAHFQAMADALNGEVK